MNTGFLRIFWLGIVLSAIALPQISSAQNGGDASPASSQTSSPASSSQSTPNTPPSQNPNQTQETPQQQPAQPQQQPTQSQQQPTQSQQQPTQSQQQPTQSQQQPAQSQHEQAEQQLKQQEQQRILGVIPNFNTTDISNAAPLTPKQKFRLALRSSIDPFQFVAAAGDAGISQAQNAFAGYGQGAQGYFKRFGAAYADQFSGEMWGNAIFPSLLREDPRYFRKGTGSIKSRFLWALVSTVRTKNDNGTWGPNYANVLGNIAAGGLSNLYYPSTDRGVGLTFQRAFTVTAEGALGSLFVEFWPDISRRVFRKHTENQTSGTDQQ